MDYTTGLTSGGVINHVHGLDQLFNANHLDVVATPPLQDLSTFHSLVLPLCGLLFPVSHVMALAQAILSLS